VRTALVGVLKLYGQERAHPMIAPRVGSNVKEPPSMSLDEPPIPSAIAVTAAPSVQIREHGSINLRSVVAAMFCGCRWKGVFEPRPEGTQRSTRSWLSSSMRFDTLFSKCRIGTAPVIA